jgi:hypothetical protein
MDISSIMVGIRYMTHRPSRLAYDIWHIVHHGWHTIYDTSRRNLFPDPRISRIVNQCSKSLTQCYWSQSLAPSLNSVSQHYTENYRSSNMNPTKRPGELTTSKITNITAIAGNLASLYVDRMPTVMDDVSYIVCQPWWTICHISYANRDGRCVIYRMPTMMDDMSIYRMPTVMKDMDMTCMSTYKLARFPAMAVILVILLVVNSPGLLVGFILLDL